MTIKVTCDRCKEGMKVQSQYYLNNKWVDLCGVCETAYEKVFKKVEKANKNYSQNIFKSFMEAKDGITSK
ncbi:hypothetical protein LCGC14_1821760 [marine sediment metagenome]|uniref:LIM zinc-binding domain-containing protein n=1 Tax=marine sediment metagenome TaxID=412755 RepID=A0A0F9H6U1_9ZZZZ